MFKFSHLLFTSAFLCVSCATERSHLADNTLFSKSDYAKQEPSIPIYNIHSRQSITSEKLSKSVERYRELANGLLQKKVKNDNYFEWLMGKEKPRLGEGVTAESTPEMNKYFLILRKQKGLQTINDLPVNELEYAVFIHEQIAQKIIDEAKKDAIEDGKVLKPTKVLRYDKVSVLGDEFPEWSSWSEIKG
jgi:hypothetical protein